MAKDNPDTPEKQLLKLIENPGRDAVHQESAKREGKKLFSLNALKGRLAFLQALSAQKWGSFKGFAANPIGLQQVNVALKVIIIFLTLYLGYSIFAMALQMKKASNLILTPDKQLPIEAEQPSVIKNLSHYLENVEKRDIFQFGKNAKPEKRKQDDIPLPEPKKPKRNFSLVGIAWSDNPEAMIEDTDQKRTYFVKRGQPLGSSTKVVAIFKDRVVVSDAGEEIELK